MPPAAELLPAKTATQLQVLLLILLLALPTATVATDDEHPVAAVSNEDSFATGPFVDDQLRHQRGLRSASGDEALGWNSASVSVSSAAQLLAAFRDASVTDIRLTASPISLDSPEWRALWPPLLLNRSVVIWGGGRSQGSLTGSYYELDCAFLSRKLNLQRTSQPSSPTTLGSTADGGNSSSNSSSGWQLAFRGLYLRNHMPPTGYGLLLLDGSWGSTVSYEDVYAERTAGLPLSYTAAEAATLPALAGQPPNAFALVESITLPGAEGTGASDTGALPGILYTTFAAEIQAEVGAAAQGLSGVASSASGGGGSSSSSSGASPNAAERALLSWQPADPAARYLVILTNVSYIVRHAVQPECVEAYGADACVYEMLEQLQQQEQQQEGASGRQLSAAAGAGIAVAATLGVCIAALALYGFVRHVKSGHRTLTMAVRPPGAGPMTTLVVTDIQNSTNLWEALPTAVMNEALKMHHRCIRGLLLKCNGYESATEGDSFILAFHGPLDAARFALLAQAALMELPWPTELLGHEDGKEVWAEPARPKVGSIPTLSHHHAHHTRGWASLLVGGLGGGHIDEDDDDGGISMDYDHREAHTSHGSHHLNWLGAFSPGARRRASLESPTPFIGRGAATHSGFQDGPGGFFKPGGLLTGRKSLNITAPWSRPTTDGAAAAGDGGGAGRWLGGLTRHKPFSFAPDAGGPVGRLRGSGGRGTVSCDLRLLEEGGEAEGQEQGARASGGAAAGGAPGLLPDAIRVVSLETLSRAGSAPPGTTAAAVGLQESGGAGVIPGGPRASMRGPSRAGQEISLRGTGSGGGLGGDGGEGAEAGQQLVEAGRSSVPTEVTDVAGSPGLAPQVSPASTLPLTEPETAPCESLSASSGAAGMGPVALGIVGLWLSNPPACEPGGGRSGGAGPVGEGMESIESADGREGEGEDTGEAALEESTGLLGFDPEVLEALRAEVVQLNRRRSEQQQQQQQQQQQAPPPTPGQRRIYRSLSPVHGTLPSVPSRLGLRSTMSAVADGSPQPPAAATSPAAASGFTSGLKGQPHSPEGAPVSPSSAGLAFAEHPSSRQGRPWSSSTGRPQGSPRAMHATASTGATTRLSLDPRELFFRTDPHLRPDLGAPEVHVHDAATSTAGALTFPSAPISSGVVSELLLGPTQLGPLAALPSLGDLDHDPTAHETHRSARSPGSYSPHRRPHTAGAFRAATTAGTGAAAVSVGGVIDGLESRVRRSLDGSGSGRSKTRSYTDHGFRSASAEATAAGDAAGMPGVGGMPAAGAHGGAAAMMRMPSQSHAGMMPARPPPLTLLRQVTSFNGRNAAAGGDGGGGGGSGLPSNTSRRSLVRMRTQFIEEPLKVPEVRETWRDMCRRNWPVVIHRRTHHSASGAVSQPESAHPPHAADPSSPFDALDTEQFPPSPRLGAREDRGSAEGYRDRERESDPAAEGAHHSHNQQGHGAGHTHTGMAMARPTKHGHRHSNGSAAVLLFRGFRVRIGMHTGVPLRTDVMLNHTSGHIAYSGLPLKVAKAVGDGAAGGSTLMSNVSYNIVVQHLAELPHNPELHYSGDAQIELVIRSMFLITSRDLAPRMGYLPPLRNLRIVQHGNLEAPVGTVAICFMTVAGASKAVAELGQPAVDALHKFKSIVTRECCQAGGYVVEATDGLCLAAFVEPAAAAIWALSCKKVLHDADWPREVLNSPHFREVREAVSRAPTRGPSQASRRAPTAVVCRGPRTRTGIAMGPVTAEVSSATHRLTYRGKVMNRSARVAAQASDNQVIMSAAAWRRVVATLGLRLLQQQHEQAAAAGGGGDGDKDSDSAAVPWWRRGDDLSRQGTADSGGGGGSAAGGLSAATAGSKSGGGGGGDVRAANGLLAAAELLMRTGSRGVDDEAAEAALSEATAAAAAIPELPSGQWLTGHSAGTFVLKGVAEPQELYEVKLAPAPPAPSAAGGALQRTASIGGSKARAMGLARAPSITSKGGAAAGTTADPATFHGMPSGLASIGSQPPSVTSAAVGAEDPADRLPSGARTAARQTSVGRNAGAGGSGSGVGRGGGRLLAGVQMEFPSAPSGLALSLSMGLSTIRAPHGSNASTPVTQSAVTSRAASFAMLPPPRLASYIYPPPAALAGSASPAATAAAAAAAAHLLGAGGPLVPYSPSASHLTHGNLYGSGGGGGGGNAGMSSAWLASQWSGAGGLGGAAQLPYYPSAGASRLHHSSLDSPSLGQRLAGPAAFAEASPYSTMGALAAAGLASGVAGRVSGVGSPVVQHLAGFGHSALADSGGAVSARRAARAASAEVFLAEAEALPSRSGSVAGPLIDGALLAELRAAIRSSVALVAAADANASAVAAAAAAIAAANAPAPAAAVALNLDAAVAAAATAAAAAGNASGSAAEQQPRTPNVTTSTVDAASGEVPVATAASSPAAAAPFIGHVDSLVRDFLLPADGSGATAGVPAAPPPGAAAMWLAAVHGSGGLGMGPSGSLPETAVPVTEEHEHDQEQEGVWGPMSAMTLGGDGSIGSLLATVAGGAVPAAAAVAAAAAAAGERASPDLVGPGAFGVMPEQLPRVASCQAAPVVDLGSGGRSPKQRQQQLGGTVTQKLMGAAAFSLGGGSSRLAGDDLLEALAAAALDDRRVSDGAAGPEAGSAGRKGSGGGCEP